MNGALVLQAPAQPTELVLLFHGVGASPRDLAPVGARIAEARPSAFVASIAAPDASDFGTGRQWFSVRGVTEDNRPARVRETLPRFLATVRDWQQRAGVGAAQTTLVGFSQGAIMALASTAQADPPAAHVVSLSGRYDALPEQAPRGVRIHFIHGDADPVIPAAHAYAASQRLQALGGDASYDAIAGLGHGIDARALEILLQRLAA
ncbi:esterase [Ramlibacter sp. XY19]|uniref:esterase n=1 Tax=Ramlibacter paludis TaxID=2908000 RepID=UPI0023D9D7BD|nr:esterase [Ramlibacter paludis]MCG2591930.1 esterase [Ramlibacter paludis]